MINVIGIGGCSRSGKSVLAQQIKDHLFNKRVLLLDMDDFVFPEENIPKIKDRTDWECPGSVDFNRLYSTIKNHQDSYDLIVVEGILAFANKSLMLFYDSTIWIQLSKETFLTRRKKETRWGDEPDWFITHVWDSYLHYGQWPEADFILSGEKEISKTALNEIVRRVVN
ncbi:nucleoside/nucleotide kinase family protein [Ekhidna sp.]